MTVRAALKAELTPLIGASVFAGELAKQGPKATKKVMDGIQKKHGKRLIRPMHRMSPGRSKHGGRWSTDAEANTRAQNWWFANRSKLKKRSGELRKQFVIVVRVTSRRVTMTIENPAKQSKFVFSFAQRPKPRGGRPNPGHIATGWPKTGRKTALKQLDSAKTLVQTAYKASAAATIARGKFVIVIP